MLTLEGQTCSLGRAFTSDVYYLLLILAISYWIPRAGVAQQHMYQNNGDVVGLRLIPAVLH